MDLKSFTKNLKSHWVLLAQAATFISLTVTGLISPPSYFGPASEASETKQLAAFITTLLVAIFFYLGHRLSVKRYAGIWVVITVVLAVTLVASVELFSQSKSHCVCQFLGEQVGIGTEYTDLGKNEALKNPGGLPCNEMLMNFQGKPERIWTGDSIDSCRSKLKLWFLTTYIAAVLSMLSGLQILRCVKAKK